MARHAFAPRAVPTIAMALFVALTLSLSRWQAHRAEEKSRLQAQMEARLGEPPLTLTGATPSEEPLLFRRVHAAGEWIAQGQVFIDNRVEGGRAGFDVVTPLRLRGTHEAVLVNRGWIERTAAYPAAPEVAVPAGPVEVTGIAAVPPRRFIELSPQTITGNVWQNLSLERYAHVMRMAVLPVVILDDHPPAGLTPVHERPDAGVAKHVEYEYTWLALALTAIALWIALNVKRTA
ncbi:MAG TPA: SURF1 family protein [Usitatibacter sp.]|jgi:surfeit locus 1 family protein|nr:SURF1 family protein [Usitatibacter sp.]